MLQTPPQPSVICSARFTKLLEHLRLCPVGPEPKTNGGTVLRRQSISPNNRKRAATLFYMGSFVKTRKITTSVFTNEKWKNKTSHAQTQLFSGAYECTMINNAIKAIVTKMLLNL